MSQTEQTLERADRALAGARGAVVAWLVARRGLTRPALERVIFQLRRAADILEELL